MLHPHAGGNIEFADEIDAAAANLTGMCLDTGHLCYSGMSPPDWLEKYQDRLDYVHFKDVNKRIYDDVLQRKTGFFETCAGGVMCPIGKGDADYRAVKATLDNIAYKGWIMVEQERDPKICDGILNDARDSLKYLNDCGY